MPTPSLILVPARFKTGKLYTPVATTSGGVVLGASGDFNVTRATTATRVNASGFIESVASGIPRLDYPLGGGCPALLVEPSGSNLALQSQTLDVSGTWSNSNNTQVTANTTGTTDPAGSTLSDLIFCQASGTAAQGLTQSISISTSGTYTMSVFVKKASNFDWFRIQFQDPTSTVYQAYYNLVSGTLGAVDAGSTATITSFGNGWYRVTHSRSTATGSVSFGLRLANANSVLTVPCDGTSGVYAWGAQLEAGSVATSYIPTTAAAVTRNADAISLSDAVSGCIGQTEGTIYLEVDAPSASSQFFRIRSGVANAIHIYKNASDRYQVRIYPSASNVDLTDTSARSGFVKIAIAYKSGESALVINGGTPITSAVAYSFSAALDSVNFLGGVESLRPTRIRAAALYTTRLTNSELAALTT